MVMIISRSQRKRLRRTIEKLKYYPASISMQEAEDRILDIILKTHKHLTENPHLLDSQSGDQK